MWVATVGFSSDGWRSDDGVPVKSRSCEGGVVAAVVIHRQDDGDPSILGLRWGSIQGLQPNAANMEQRGFYCLVWMAILEKGRLMVAGVAAQSFWVRLAFGRRSARGGRHLCCRW